jgi:AraC family transcriptional regulator
MSVASSRSRITYGLERRAKQLGCFRVVETWHRSGTVLHRHDHEEASLNIVIDGGFVEGIGSKEISSSRGTLVIKPAGSHHANTYRNTRTVSILAHIPAASILELGILGRAFGETRSWQNDASLALGCFLHDALQDAGLDYLEAEERLIETLADLANVEEPRFGFAAPRWVQRVRDHLAECATGSVSIGEIARGEGTNSVVLAKGFRRAYGISATQFVRQVRVGHARGLLQEPSMRLTDVGLTVGFADQAHFTRAFKRELGVTPGQYRRLLCSK